jgi:integrase
VFGRSAGLPFSPKTLAQRASRAWEAAALRPIGLHECRHTFASLMIAAGVNAKALQTFMGHASITITLDRYGHLFPGARARRPRCSMPTSLGPWDSLWDSRGAQMALLRPLAAAPS